MVCCILITGHLVSETEDFLVECIDFAKQHSPELQN